MEAAVQSAALILGTLLLIALLLKVLLLVHRQSSQMRDLEQRMNAIERPDALGTETKVDTSEHNERTRIDG